MLFQIVLIHIVVVHYSKMHIYPPIIKECGPRSFLLLLGHLTCEQTTQLIMPVLVDNGPHTGKRCRQPGPHSLGVVMAYSHQ